MSTRIELLPPRPDDAGEFLAMVAASRSLHRPWSAPPDSPERFAAWCERVADPRHVPRIVRLRGGGPIVGVVNLSELVRGALDGCFIGWYGAAGHGGAGYLTEAVVAAVTHGFTRLGLHRVEANIQPGNTASRRLAVRAGFRCEGYSPRYLRIDGDWRDHERWAILNDPPAG